jgi:hypothetical protein
MTAQSEKSIICKKPRLTALHAGIVLTPPLGLMKENNPKVANKAIKVQLPSQPGSTALREAGETAKSLYDQVNPMFEKITGHSLVKALTKVKDLNIEEKKSKAEKKRTVRNNYRKFKEAGETEWENTSFIRYLKIIKWVAGMTNIQ